MQLSLNIAPRNKAVVVHGGSSPAGYRDVLEALERAVALGADGFELDVRRTRDGTLVVHHDDAIDGAALGSLSYAAADYRARQSGYRLPTFESVLEQLRGMLSLDIELKESGYERQVLDAAVAAGFTAETIVVTSFEQAALDGVHAAEPAIRTGLLVWGCSWPEALDRFRGSGAAFLGPDHQILDAAALASADRARVVLLPWTVNGEAAALRLLDAAAVAGVITDDPLMAMRCLMR